MINIKENYGKFLSMMLNTMDRKNVTNQEARRNFKECIIDYCQVLYTMTPLTLSNNSPLKKHYDYATKLDILLGRYKMIGNDYLSDDKLDTFLTQMQSMMMEWNTSDELELAKEEKQYYLKEAWKNGSNRGVESEWSWQEEKSNTIKSALERHKDLAFKNLG